MICVDNTIYDICVIRDIYNVLLTILFFLYFIIDIIVIYFDIPSFIGKIGICKIYSIVIVTISIIGIGMHITSIIGFYTTYIFDASIDIIDIISTICNGTIVITNTTM